MTLVKIIAEMDAKIRHFFGGKNSKIVRKNVSLNFWAIRTVAENDENLNAIVSLHFRALADIRNAVLDATIRSSETSDISFCGVIRWC